MPTEQHSTNEKTCKDCGLPESGTNYRFHGRRCKACRRKRLAFVKENPSAPRESRAPKRFGIWDRLQRHRLVDHNGCWNWTAFRDKQGYGRISNVQIPGTTKRQFGVHRLVAHLVHGLDLNDRSQYACHHCDNPACFNPAHLFVGTAKENIADCKRKGRELHARGEDNGGGGKLTEDDVREIRQLRHSGMLQREIASRFGIDQTMVSMVELRKEWAHVA